MQSILEQLNENKLIVLDEFVSPSECQLMLDELRFAYWSDSVVVDYIGDENAPAYLSGIRRSKTSGQVWFSQELNDALAPIEDRLACLLTSSRAHFEEWQATQYERGDKFEYHVDGGNWEHTPAGERKRSILIYLETPARGGATHFRVLNRKIEAKVGRVLIWNNLLSTGKSDFSMIHAGLPVEEGRKTILVSWEREHPLRVS